ncbi:ANTAR domain-containing protein [Streptomyces composti]|nr:ANTAR domain-containing protein [Streptomyces composti]
MVIGARMDGDRALLTPCGMLGQGCVRSLAGTLARLPAGTARVDVDMSGVHFMDTAGLRFLDVLRDFARRRSLPVTATRWNGQPRRMLESAGLDPADPLNQPPRVVPPRPAPDAEQAHTLQSETEQFRDAVAARPLVDRARGILMARYGCTSDEAWDVLREAARLAGSTLPEIAAALTPDETATDSDPPDGIRQALSKALTGRPR